MIQDVIGNGKYLDLVQVCECCFELAGGRRGLKSKCSNTSSLV